MKISAQPCVSMGTNSARLGLSLRGGGAQGGAEAEDEDGGPRLSSVVAAEDGDSGAASSPSDGDTKGLRLWAGPARRA